MPQHRCPAARRRLRVTVFDRAVAAACGGSRPVRRGAQSSQLVSGAGTIKPSGDETLHHNSRLPKIAKAMRTRCVPDAYRMCTRCVPDAYCRAVSPYHMRTICGQPPALLLNQRAAQRPHLRLAGLSRLEAATRPLL